MSLRSYPLEVAPTIVELRQYLLHRGRRDELIELFDREFVETKEALGIRVIGQFRDVDRVNHFVWLRGFSDHDARRDALTSFYSGPVWRKHGSAAAATMIDSGDVHQLGPTNDRRHQLLIRDPRDRDANGDRGSVLILVAHRRCDDPLDQDQLLREQVIPMVEEAGVRTLGIYETDPSENAYPALPVRSSSVLVWIAAGSTEDTLDAAARQLAIARHQLAGHASAHGLDEILLDVLRLEPTGRSCLNGTDVVLGRGASTAPGAK
jgi:NIPSNAP